MKPMHRMLLSWLAACSVTACYKYTPVETPRLGMEVRTQLETEAAVRRSQGLDEPRVRYDGVIVDLTPESLTLDVLIARTSSAFQDVVIRDTVTLETVEVRSIMQRRISPVKTAAFALGAGAAAVAIVAGIDAVVGGTGDDGDDGPPQANRVPLLSWKSARLLASIFGAGRD